MSYTGEYRQQKHSQHAPSTTTECDYLYGWIQKTGHTPKNLTQKKVNPRDIAGNIEEEEKVIRTLFFLKIQKEHKMHTETVTNYYLHNIFYKCFGICTSSKRLLLKQNHLHL